jgi:hypothetical protein
MLGSRAPGPSHEVASSARRRGHLDERASRAGDATSSERRLEGRAAARRARVMLAGRSRDHPPLGIQADYPEKERLVLEGHLRRQRRHTGTGVRRERPRERATKPPHGRRERLGRARLGHCTARPVGRARWLAPLSRTATTGAAQQELPATFLFPASQTRVCATGQYNAP